MSTDDGSFDFLTQPGNLTTALEVADYVDRLKHKMHKDFWSVYNPRIQGILLRSEYANVWRYDEHPSTKFRTPWGKSYRGSPNASGAEPHRPQRNLCSGRAHPSPTSVCSGAFAGAHRPLTSVMLYSPIWPSCW